MLDIMNNPFTRITAISMKCKITKKLILNRKVTVNIMNNSLTATNCIKTAKSLLTLSIPHELARITVTAL